MGTLTPSPLLLGSRWHSRRGREGKRPHRHLQRGKRQSECSQAHLLGNGGWGRQARSNSVQPLPLGVWPTGCQDCCGEALWAGSHLVRPSGQEGTAHRHLGRSGGRLEHGGRQALTAWLRGSAKDRHCLSVSPTLPPPSQTGGLSSLTPLGSPQGGDQALLSSANQEMSSFSPWQPR